MITYYMLDKMNDIIYHITILLLFYYFDYIKYESNISLYSIS